MIRTDELHLKKVEYLVEMDDELKSLKEKLDECSDKAEVLHEEIMQCDTKLTTMIKGRQYTTEDGNALIKKVEEVEERIRMLNQAIESRLRKCEELINLDPCVDMKPYDLSKLSTKNTEVCYMLKLSDKEADRQIKQIKKICKGIVKTCKKKMAKFDKIIAKQKRKFNKY